MLFSLIYPRPRTGVPSEDDSGSLSQNKRHLMCAVSVTASTRLNQLLHDAEPRIVLRLRYNFYVQPSVAQPAKSYLKEQIYCSKV